MIRSEKVKSERGVLLFIILNSKSNEFVPFLFQKTLPNQALGGLYLDNNQQQVVGKRGKE